MIDKWDRLALLFAFLTVGAFGETMDILTSAEPDERSAVLIMGGAITATCFFFALKFFLKKKN